jgi:hypothetical protein
LIEPAIGRLAFGALEAAVGVTENFFQEWDTGGVSGFANPMAVAKVADDALLFGQKNISEFFSKAGSLKGTSVESIVGQLKSGTLKADALPIEFVVIEGQKVAANNRSLAAPGRLETNKTD